MVSENIYETIEENDHLYNHRMLTDVSDYYRNGVKLYEDFLTYFHLKDHSDNRNTINLIYFAFTSLSTVGFGDMHPRSDLERVIGAFVLLLGVNMFSFIMGIFIAILEDYKRLESELDDGDNLSKFFGLMTRLNDNVPIDIKIIKKIENHFDYKWEFDRNQAIDDELEQALLDQLPD